MWITELQFNRKQNEKTGNYSPCQREGIQGPKDTKEKSKEKRNKKIRYR